MNRAFAIAAVLATGLTAHAAQASTVIFSEDFSGATDAPSGASIATTIPRYTAADAAFTGGAHLSFRRTGGVSTYETGAIDVSGFSTLNLSFDFFAQGDWELRDTVQALVSLDGGSSFLTLFSLAGNSVSPVGRNNRSQDLQLTNVSQDLDDGSSVVFRFLVDASAKKEVAGLDNIVLTGSPIQVASLQESVLETSGDNGASEIADIAPVPVPASVLFLLGGLGALGAMRARRNKSKA